MSLVLGSLLRSGKYSTIRVAHDAVHKRRRFYAPLLIGAGGPLMTMLDTGVRVLPHRAWTQRERALWPDIRVTPSGALVMPVLTGTTLAALLDDPSSRHRAIALAATALADLHRRGITHGDAMAVNVMVDVESGVARCFDFETVHDADRSMAWCRADDVRALLATCLLRTRRAGFAATLQIIVDACADEEVTRHLVGFFAPRQRPLAFHLGQAALAFEDHQEIGRLLRERVRG